MVRVFLLLSLLFGTFKAQGNVDLQYWQQGAIGYHLNYFQEGDTPLTWQQAQQKFNSRSSFRSFGQSLSLGIGVAPVWLKTTLQNTGSAAIDYRMSVETPWLDYIDTFLIHNGEMVAHITGGDGYPFEKRPMAHRYYSFDYSYPPGQTEVLIRIESAGPMAIPIHLASTQAAQRRDIRAGYEYGVLYGIMLALALYNFILFINIKQAEFGLYSLYLVGFIANSLSYTGQIHAIFTPDFGPYFQDWVDIFLMITYSVVGLLFARKVLNTQSYAPTLDKVTLGFASIIPAGMLIGAAINSLFLSMILAFLLNTSFAVLFIVLGIRALKARVNSAKLFLVSSVTAAICIAISTGAVAGIFPLNDVTFKLIEVGMAFEAVVLAVLLAQRFRSAQQDKLIAEHVAQTDELTALLNRRGFRQHCDLIFDQDIVENRDIAVLLIDIDKFKGINDTYGHAGGDAVLENIAKCISSHKRGSRHIYARWGGEEFIIYLSGVPQHEAEREAESLRARIENLITEFRGIQLSVTVSVGISGSEGMLYNGEPLSTVSIETIINQADIAMYDAKISGGNQICSQYFLSPSMA